jgi:hypothetical protein
VSADKRIASGRQIELLMGKEKALIAFSTL